MTIAFWIFLIIGIVCLFVTVAHPAFGIPAGLFICCAGLLLVMMIFNSAFGDGPCDTLESRVQHPECYK